MVVFFPPPLGTFDCYKVHYTETKSHLSTPHFLGSDSVIPLYLLQFNELFNNMPILSIIVSCKSKQAVYAYSCLCEIRY